MTAATAFKKLATDLPPDLGMCRKTMQLGIGLVCCCERSFLLLRDTRLVAAVVSFD